MKMARGDDEQIYNIHTHAPSLYAKKLNLDCAGKSMGDGVFHLLVVRKPVSRARLLDLFLQIEAGKHIDCDTVRPFPSNAGGEIFYDYS